MKTLILLIASISLAILVKDKVPALFVSEPSRVITVSQITHTPTPTPSRPEVIYEISKQFDKFGADVVSQSLLVAKHESGWRYNAQGWNCLYDGVSAPCKVQDRSNAWSVDCGIMQINVRGTVCPVELFDIKTNISKAVAMYEHRKWSPWVAANKLGYVN